MKMAGELNLGYFDVEDANPEGRFPSAREFDDEVTDGREQEDADSSKLKTFAISNPC